MWGHMSVTGEEKWRHRGMHKLKEKAPFSECAEVSQAG
jgi:hypothetical protein